MGALTLIRFVRARGKFMKHISSVLHFLHETFVRVRRRIQGIRMELRVSQKRGYRIRIAQADGSHTPSPVRHR